MTATKLTKKPITIEGTQWDGTAAGIVTIQNDFGQYGIEISGVNVGTEEGHLEVYDKLHDSYVKVFPTQWVLRGVQGEFYPCDDSVRQSTYTVGTGEDDVVDAEVID